MPKIIVVETNSKYKIVDCGEVSSEQFSKSLNSAVEGWIEVVRPATGILEKGHVMIVNEEGHCKGLNLNLIGTKIYGYGIIVGNVVICKESMADEGHVLFPFSDDEVEAVVKRLKLKLSTTF